MKTFGEKVKKARIKKGLTQSQLADLLGVDNSTISYVEAGERNFGFRVLLKALKILKLKI